MRMRAFERLGHEVVGVHTVEPWTNARWLSRQLQRRLGRGSIIDKLNERVVNVAREFRPQLVWAEKQEFLWPDTVAELRAMGATLVHFTPDPYFFIKWKRTPLMDDAIRQFDVLVYCKAYERSDYEALDKKVVYMPLGYCDEVHHPRPSSDPAWACTVGFLGGWDPRREHLVHKILAADIDLKIRGAYWDFLADGRWSLRRQVILRQLAGKQPFHIHRDDLIARAWQGGEVYADDYASALSGAKIGLGFLRITWPDQHTTRSFEIPACGSMLLADRTDEHREFFAEGKQADFFSSEDELIDKLKFYSTHESVREEIAAAGLKRGVDSGYAYIRRLEAVLAALG